MASIEKASSEATTTDFIQEGWSPNVQRKTELFGSATEPFHSKDVPPKLPNAEEKSFKDRCKVITAKDIQAKIDAAEKKGGDATYKQILEFLKTPSTYRWHGKEIDSSYPTAEYSLTATRACIEGLPRVNPIFTVSPSDLELEINTEQWDSFYFGEVMNRDFRNRTFRLAGSDRIQVFLVFEPKLEINCLSLDDCLEGMNYSPVKQEHAMILQKWIERWLAAHSIEPAQQVQICVVGKMVDQLLREWDDMVLCGIGRPFWLTHSPSIYIIDESSGVNVNVREKEGMRKMSSHLLSYLYSQAVSRVHVTTELWFKKKNSRPSEDIFWSKPKLERFTSPTESDQTRKYRRVCLSPRLRTWQWGTPPKFLKDEMEKNIPSARSGAEPKTFKPLLSYGMCSGNLAHLHSCREKLSMLSACVSTASYCSFSRSPPDHQQRRQKLTSFAKSCNFWDIVEAATKQDRGLIFTSTVGIRLAEHTAENTTMFTEAGEDDDLMGIKFLLSLIDQSMDSAWVDALIDYSCEQHALQNLITARQQFRWILEGFQNYLLTTYSCENPVSFCQSSSVAELFATLDRLVIVVLTGQVDSDVSNLWAEDYVTKSIVQGFIYLQPRKYLSLNGSYPYQIEQLGHSSGRVASAQAGPISLFYSDDHWQAREYELLKDSPLLPDRPELLMSDFINRSYLDILRQEIYSKCLEKMMQTAGESSSPVSMRINAERQELLGCIDSMKNACSFETFSMIARRFFVKVESGCELENAGFDPTQCRAAFEDLADSEINAAVGILNKSKVRSSGTSIILAGALSAAESKIVPENPIWSKCLAYALKRAEIRFKVNPEAGELEWPFVILGTGQQMSKDQDGILPQISYECLAWSGFDDLSQHYIASQHTAESRLTRITAHANDLEMEELPPVISSEPENTGNPEGDSIKSEDDGDLDKQETAVTNENDTARDEEREQLSEPEPAQMEDEQDIDLPGTEEQAEQRTEDRLEGKGTMRRYFKSDLEEKEFLTRVFGEEIVEETEIPEDGLHGVETPEETEQQEVILREAEQEQDIEEIIPREAEPEQEIEEVVPREAEPEQETGKNTPEKVEDEEEIGEVDDEPQGDGGREEVEEDEEDEDALDNDGNEKPEHAMFSNSQEASRWGENVVYRNMEGGEEEPVEDDDPTAIPDMTSASKAIVNAKTMVVLCGAGVSVSAGIPAFRGKNSLSEQEKKFFEHQTYKADEAAWFQQLYEYWSKAKKAKPTAFHRWLQTCDGQTEDKPQLVGLFTCNIDGLERKLNINPDIVHYLHGSLFSLACEAGTCHQQFDDDETVNEQYESRFKAGKRGVCPCSEIRQAEGLRDRKNSDAEVGSLRPTLQLYEDTYWQSRWETDHCGTINNLEGRRNIDIGLIIGTSLPDRVKSLKDLVQTMRFKCKTVIYVGPEPPADIRERISKKGKGKKKGPKPRPQVDWVVECEADYFAKAINARCAQLPGERALAERRKGAKEAKKAEREREKMPAEMPEDPIDEEDEEQPSGKKRKQAPTEQDKKGKQPAKRAKTGKRK